MNLRDKTLICRVCGCSFLFAVEEQRFFAQKGLTDPSRCPPCRRARSPSHGDYSGSRHEPPKQELFPIVCARCGKNAMVPFQPQGDRPSYCHDCYAATRTRRGRY